MRAYGIPAEYRPKRDEQKCFGIDFDDTYTAAPDAFDGFIKSLIGGGHDVYFVTYRDGGVEDILSVADKLGIGVIATDGEQKISATESLGITVDIWVDDRPELIIEATQ